jgi:dolichyl-phosphate-mannose--protein O-mannosyl transferase
VNVALIWTVVDAVRRRRRKNAALRDESSPPTLGAHYLWMLWFLPLLPWIFSNRDSYLYHYLPSYVFGLVLLAGLVSKLGTRRALQLGFVIAVAAVFVFCVPVWSKIPFGADSLLHTLFFSARG